MKAEKAKTSVVSRIWETMTRNWGLKLLSLAIAIILYHSLKSENSSSRNPNDRSIFQDNK